MDLNQVAILDTETTGTDSETDRLVEVAMLSAATNDYYSTLCDPGRGIPPEAMAVHHITEADVRGRPTPAQALKAAVESLDWPRVSVAHNAKFDRGMIPDVGWNPQWVCTYKCAIVQWPDAPGYSNQVLRYWLGLQPTMLLDHPHLSPHRALYDIIVTREIFKALLMFRPLDELIHISNNPVLLTKVSFGKHKGSTWDKVDKGYLSWVVRQEDMNEDVRYTAEYYLRRR